MNNHAGNAFEITIKRTIAAPRERVFDAWLDPDILCRWFAPSDEMSCEVKALDAREGGRYHIEMRGSDGESYNLHGEYLSIDRPNRLQFTWVSPYSQSSSSLLTF